MADLPSGTVTFLLTDIEGSTRLWERQPEAMRLASRRHDAIVEERVDAHGGALVRARGEGDSRFAVFALASDAVAAACDIQRALQAESWPQDLRLRVRIALHTGEASCWQGVYQGAAVNRCARLRALAHGGQTVLSQATERVVQGALPEGVSLLYLGEHRLKDLGRPEHVYQVNAAGLPEEFPPLLSLGNLPNNLPLQLTSFVGRDEELAAIRDLLGQTRLLTLTGPGGTGKTRLALQAATEVLEDFEHGAWLVELGGLGDPQLVPQTAALALGLGDRQDHSAVEAMVGYLRARSLLLVLDNCEHLLSACSRLVETLLSSCPRLKVLATSREVLGVPGETAFRVQPLPLPSPGHLPTRENSADYAALRLFVERARAAAPDFELDAASLPAVAEICWRLEGIPLAIELAAARVRALPVEAIASRLSDVFRLLTGGARTALPHHRTLRATMDWSHDLLSPSERELLRRLSVFAGGWDLEAAEALGSGDGLERWEVLDLLISLVDKSLVSRDLEGDGRYRMLEVIRQYAWERLEESGELESLRDRHLRHFVDLAEQAEQHCLGPDQARWLRRLATEHDNLRAALDRCRGRPERAVLGLRLAAALEPFWEVRGHLSEGRGYLKVLLEESELQARDPGLPGVEPRLRARALSAAGQLAYWQGDPDEARRLLTESADLFRTLGDRAGLAGALLGLGRLDSESGAPAAPDLLEEALALYRELDDTRGVGVTLRALGEAAYLRNDRSAARPLLEESTRHLRRAGAHLSLSYALDRLALLSWEAGDLGQAQALFEESIALQRSTGARWGLCWSLVNLSNIARLRGDLERARAHAEESVRECAELGNPANLGWTVLCLSNTCFVQGDVEAADSHCREVLRLWSEAPGIEGSLPFALERYASILAATHRPEEAARLLGAADRLREESGSPLPPIDREEYHAALEASLRSELGEESYARAWIEGRRLSSQEAIEHALSSAPAVASPPEARAARA